MFEEKPFMWNMCFSSLAPPEGDRSFFWHSSFRKIKTQIGLINNCTLVFDIDAIVLHTDSDTMEQNHVLHIVFSVSLI